MKKKIISILCAAILAGTIFAGCSSNTSTGNADSGASVSSEDDSEENSAVSSSDDSAEKAGTDAENAELPDGVYTAEFDTDNSMFHVNEANEGKGVLTVENGKMTIHVSLVSKNIVNLFVGTAEDAQKDGADILQPTTDTVTYSDGISEEVYGFDIPVPVLDEEFDVALIGTKDKWYDHKVSVSNPQPQE